MPKTKHISDILATEAAVEAFRLAFACRRCGACCTTFDGVRVTRAEMKKLNIPAEEYDEKFIVMGNTYYMKQPCPFYSAAKPGCTNYNNRPETCRRFPMYSVQCDDGLAHLAASELCQAAVEALGAIESEELGR